MANRLELEDFGTPVAASPGQGTAPDPAAAEDIRLSAFEDGYGAGWNDAVAADQNSQTKVSQDFAQNLSDLSFTYHEARNHLTTAAEPIFKELIEKVFPSLIVSGLGAQVLETLSDEVGRIANAPVELVCSPSNTIALTELVGENAPMPINISEEPTLTDGQVFLRFATEERRIDLDEIQTGMDSAISAFFQNLKTEVNYGT